MDDDGDDKDDDKKMRANMMTPAIVAKAMIMFMEGGGVMLARMLAHLRRCRCC